MVENKKTLPLTKKEINAGELVCNIAIRQIIEVYYYVDVQHDIPGKMNVEDESPHNIASPYIHASNVDFIIIDDDLNAVIPAFISIDNSTKSITRIIRSSAEDLSLSTDHPQANNLPIWLIDKERQHVTQTAGLLGWYIRHYKLNWNVRQWWGVWSI